MDIMVARARAESTLGTWLYRMAQSTSVQKNVPIQIWIYAIPRTHGTLNAPHAAEDKTLNLHSAVSRHTEPSSPLILSAAYLVLSLSLPLSCFPSPPSPFLRSLFPSPRPNAAHNSRSQFSISVDFSIRLRGAAVPTRETWYSSFAAGCHCPLVPDTGMSHRHDDIANWKALGDPSPPSPPPRVSLTSG